MNAFWASESFEDFIAFHSSRPWGRVTQKLQFQTIQFSGIRSREKVLVEGNFTMDGSIQPKHIAWIDSIGDDAGKVIQAIYEFKGDSFRFAAADPGMPRPIDFSGGYGITNRTFARV